MADGGKRPRDHKPSLDNTMEGVLSDGSVDPDDAGDDSTRSSPWFLEDEKSKENVIPSGFDGLRVIEIIGSSK